MSRIDSNCTSVQRGTVSASFMQREESMRGFIHTKKVFDTHGKVICSSVF